MKKFASLVALFFCICAAAFISGCSGASSSDGLVYKMGVILPLGGSDAEAARDALAGMEIARDQINVEGGMDGAKLALSVADSSSKDYEFSSAYNSMIGKGVKVFNIGFGQDTVKLQKYLSSDDTIFVNYLSSYPPVTLDVNNCTRIFMNAAQEGDVMAAAVDRSDDSERQLVLMSVNNLEGKAAGDYLAFSVNVGKNKIYKDVFGVGETRFDIFSAQIKRLWAEYVFYVGNGRELPHFLESVGKADFKGVLVANCGFYYDNISSVPEGIKLLRVETLFQQGKIKTKVSEDFVREFQKRHGRKPTWAAAYGYDGIILLSKSAKSAKYNPANMREFFTGKTFEGAIGTLKFDTTADSLSEIELVRID